MESGRVYNLDWNPPKKEVNYLEFDFVFGVNVQIVNDIQNSIFNALGMVHVDMFFVCEGVAVLILRNFLNIYMGQPCWRQPNAHQSVFPNSILESFHPLSPSILGC